MITGKNESNIFTKDIACKFKCKLDGRKCNSDQKWNNDLCRYECKKHHIFEKGYICNPATCSCENGNYIASIIVDSVIPCDEIIEEIKTIRRNFNEKINLIYSCSFINKSFFILLAFLSITMVLLIAVSIYCYLIKYRENQKHLLPFHITNNKLINVLIN